MVDSVQVPVFMDLHFRPYEAPPAAFWAVWLQKVTKPMGSEEMGLKEQRYFEIGRLFSADYPLGIKVRFPQVGSPLWSMKASVPQASDEK